MSVLRELTLNHMAITPSMECARIDEQLSWLTGHLQQLTTALPQAITGDVSMESSSYLSAIGYSTEAEAGGKTLVQRIWQGIKTIFAKIKAYLGRLISTRKHHLKGNEFKIDKLKKYIQNIDLDKKPEGDMHVHTTLLPSEPGHAVSAVGEFRNQAKHVMDFRTHALNALLHVDLTTLATKDAASVIKGIQNGGSVLSKKSGTHATFTNADGALDYRTEAPRNNPGEKVVPASILTMNALVKEYEHLVEDDAKFNQQIEKEASSSDKFLKDLEKLMETNSFRNLEMPDNFDDYDALSKKAAHIFKECSELSTFMTKVERLVHTFVWDYLYGDIENLLQKSLAQYKFKKHELHEEDRGGVDEGAKRYREEQARDKERAEKERNKKDGDHEYR